MLEVPTSGTIEIDGELVNESNLLTMRKKVGMVFQQFNLFKNLTVMGNITYAPINVLSISPKEARSRAMELIKRMGLSGKENVYPHSLSGGQKQRVAIVRSLAMSPKAIVFDEPTSALDPEMVKEVLNAIKDLAHTGITIIMNTHEMAFAKEVADRIIFLDHGKILEEGMPDEFFSNPKTDRVKHFLEKVL